MPMKKGTLGINSYIFKPILILITHVMQYVLLSNAKVLMHATKYQESIVDTR